MSGNKLWIGGYGPEESAHGIGLAAFRDHVVTATNGEVAVDVTWNLMSEGRPNTDLLGLVEAGTMFLCYFSTSYLGDRVTELNVLETPFLFPDLDTAHHTLDDRLGARLRTAVRSGTGFEVLGFWDNGFRHLTNRLRAIRSPDDCRGLSVRLQPNAIHEELIRCWGAVPIAVDLNQGIQLITSQSVDAQENPLANTVAYGVDKVHPYITMTGHLYGARGLFANRAKYESMPPALRDIVDAAAREAVVTQRAVAAANEEALRRDLEIDGLVFVDLTDDEREDFVTSAAPAVAMARRMVPADLYELVGP
ncbi:MAG TPA: TRAP transporter substrate-binding protein [Acidimicrobiia bacterium]